LTFHPFPSNGQRASRGWTSEPDDTSYPAEDFQVFRAAFEQAAVGMAHVGLDSRWLRVNRKLCQITGYSAEELLTLTFQDITLPEDLEANLHLMDRLIAGEVATGTLEKRYLRKDGSLTWVSLTVALVRDSQDRPRCFVGIIEDIDRRKRVEAQLAESEYRLRLAMEMSGLGMWHWNVVEDRLEWTPQCKRVFGLAPDDEISYARLLALLHPDDRTIVERGVEQTLGRPGTPYDVEYRTIWPDGSVHWIAARGDCLFDSRGEPLRMVGIAYDITERKRFQMQLEAQAQTIDGLLAAERAARTQAELANRAKDEFLAILSHELRTPLNPIIGWTQLLRRGELPPARQAMALEAIERNARLQNQLIADLLDVNCIQQGKFRYHSESIDFLGVVQAAVEAVHTLADAAGISLKTHLPTTEVRLWADPTRLSQVAWNLLTNAIKFTARGGWVEVSLRQQENLAILAVRDSGVGIAPKFLPHLWERFRQADSTTTRSQGGLGLGLFIVRHIVESHGGTVRAESPGVGQGATFTVELPVR